MQLAQTISIFNSGVRKMGKLEGKTIGILAEDLYEDLELWYPVHRLREEGAKIALKSKQIKKLNYGRTRLYSEDLY